MNKHNEDIRSLQLTLGLYLLIFAMKLVVYFMSNIMAMLAEALHTLSDILIAGFLLIAVFYSQKKADKMHMFGYGRAQYIAALVAATLFISFTSFELYQEAIPRLSQREETTYQNIPLAIGVLIVSMLIAATPLIKLFLQKRRGAAAKAQMLELINDELGLLAALLGTIFISLNISIADPIAAIVVATIIAINAAGLFRENLGYLLGKAPSDELIQALRNTALSVEGVLGVNDLRAEYIGPDVIHADIHINVNNSLSVSEAHSIARRVDTLIEPILGNGICEVHIDPEISDAKSGPTP